MFLAIVLITVEQKRLGILWTDFFLAFGRKELMTGIKVLKNKACACQQCL